jgi:predicted HicB family RNase H-like nuclease
MPRQTPHTVQMHVEVTPQLHEKLKRAAKREGVSISHVVRQVVDAHLTAWGKHK